MNSPRAFYVVLLLCVALLVITTDHHDDNLLLLFESRPIEARQQTTSPVVATRKTKYGDIYDIYRQPTLTHPALANHTIQLKPSRSPTHREAAKPHEEPQKMSKKNSTHAAIGCPLGSVPIRREPIRNSSSDHQFGFSNARSKIAYGIQFAGVYTSTKGEYHGTTGYAAIYRPSIDPNSQKYSSALFSIESGDGSSLDQIQVGWTVNPILYPHDNNVRMFIYFRSGVPGSSAAGCYNQLCPGFVHVNEDVAVDDVLAASTTGPDADQYVLHPYVDQDAETKDWWLSLHVNFNQVPVGYWPHELFPSLGNGQTLISWGGVVYTADSEERTPPMGSGKFVNGNYGRSAYFGGIQVLDKSSKDFVVPPDTILEKWDAFCYFAGDQSYKPTSYGYSFTYGGKGGTEQTCTRSLT